MTKIRDSAFHGTDLAQRLRLLGVRRLLVGVTCERARILRMRAQSA